MEISKIGVRILKHLKKKNDKYSPLDKSKISDSSMCFYKEIKDLFPEQSYSRVTFELISLLDEKIIFVNKVGDHYTLPVKELDTYKFGLTGKGYGLLENKTYRLLSKYIPLTVSIVSILIAIASFTYNIYSK